MGLLRKRILTLLWGVCTLFILIIAGWYWQRDLQFKTLFGSATKQEQNVADHMVGLAGAQLASFASDYSYWDDMVAFARHPDPQWAADNLEVGMPGFGASAVAVYSKEFHRVYAASSEDYPRIKIPELSPDQIREIFSRGPLCRFYTDTPEGLLEIRAATITYTSDSDRKLPAQGYWFVCKVWDTAFLNQMGTLLGAKASIGRPGGSRMVRNKSFGTMVLSNSLPGQDGRPVRTLRFVKEFREAAILQASERRTLTLLLTFALVVLSVLYFALARLVLKPVNKLCEALQSESCMPLTALERDKTELGHLASVLHQFLDQKHRLEEETRKRKQAVEALQESQGRLASTLRSIGDGVISTDADGRVTDLNTVAESLTGWKTEDAAGRHITEIFHIVSSLTQDDAENPVYRALRDGSVVEMANHTTLVSRDGSERQIADSCAPIRDQSATILGAVLVFRDVTEEYMRREQLRESEEKYRLLIDNAVSGIAVHEIVLDPWGNPVDYVFLSANPAFETQTGLRVADIIGRRATQVIPGIEDTPFVSMYGRLVLSGEPVTVEEYCAPLRRYFMISAYKVSDRQFATVFQDVTERKLAEEALATANRELERALAHSKELAQIAEQSKCEAEQRAADLDYRSTHDELTGLANRREFERQVAERAELASVGRHDPFAVLFMDLDKFKLVNDALGHDIGDLLLRETAERLRSCVRTDDLTARMGGDEFTAIVGGPHLRESCEKVAGRILDQLTRPFDIGGHRLVVGISVGIAQYPDDGITAQTLMKHADAAMYKAKQSGRGTYRWYSNEMEADSSIRLAMEHELRHAVDNNELSVFYQPIMDLKTGGLHGFEALLRWEHPTKGIISPGVFIPLAEETGLINRVGDHVLRTACAQMKTWRDEGLLLVHCGVNVSIVQLRQQSWASGIYAALADTGLEPEHLVVELTESSYTGLTGEWEDSLMSVLNTGVQAAVDDFGVGESSLSRLRDFRGAHVKLDGTFLRDITNKERQISLLRSVIKMLHEQGAKVTAEWVETEQQNEILRKCGCDYAQGYFHSRPLTAHQFREFALSRAESIRRQAA